MTQEELQEMLTSFEEEVGHIKQWQIDRNNTISAHASMGGIAVHKTGKIDYKKLQSTGKVPGGVSAGKLKKEAREKQWLSILSDLPIEFNTPQFKETANKHGMKSWSTMKLFLRKCKSIKKIHYGVNQFNPSIYQKLDKIDLDYGDYNDHTKQN